MTNQESNKDKTFDLGNLVMLKSYPFDKVSHIEQISVHGNADYLSPIMVVVARLKSADRVLKQHSSEELNETHRYQYKCIWFSSKTMGFEEVWFKHKELKCLSRDSKSDMEELRVGNSIILKSSAIELKKKKISVEFPGQTKEAKILPLHSFTSPALTCIGFQTHTPKEPQISKLTGEEIRLEASKLVKAKYYNHLHNKFSEVLLPLEAVSLVPELASEVIEAILNLISSESLCIVSSNTNNGEVGKEKIEKYIRPISLSSAGGFYFLRYINEVTQDFEEQIVNASDEFSKSSETTILGDSVFNFSDSKEEKVSKIDSQNISEEGFYCRIKYENRVGKNSSRYIKLEQNPITEIDKSQYLVGYCYSRSAIRHFRLGRIYEIKHVKEEKLIEMLRSHPPS